MKGLEVEGRGWRWNEGAGGGMKGQEGQEVEEAKKREKDEVEWWRYG